MDLFVVLIIFVDYLMTPDGLLFGNLCCQPILIIGIAKIGIFCIWEAPRIQILEKSFDSTNRKFYLFIFLFFCPGTLVAISKIYLTFVWSTIDKMVRKLTDHPRLFKFNVWKHPISYILYILYILYPISYIVYILYILYPFAMEADTVMNWPWTEIMKTALHYCSGSGICPANYITIDK